MIISNPVELVDGHVPEDTYGEGGIARATADIAVVAWTSEYYDEQSAYHEPANFAAVQYTDFGPVVGPRLTLETPTQISIANLAPGHDGQVWALLENFQTGNEIWLVRITVDPTTLKLTAVWKFQVPCSWTGSGSFIDSWPEQDVLIVGSNNGHPAEADDYWVFLIDMSSGAIIDHITTPLWDPQLPGTSTVFLEGISLHKGSGQLMVMADWYNRSIARYRCAMWTIPVDPVTGFGSWTYRADFPPSTSANYQIRWVAAAAIPDGWNILQMSDGDPSTVRWFKLSTSGTLTETPTPLPSYGRGYWSYNYPKVYDVAYDPDLDESLAAFQDTFFGLVLYESDPDTLEYSYQVLPKPPPAGALVALTQVAVVGPGRCVYLGMSTGVLRQTTSSVTSSFGAFVFLGSDTLDPSVTTGGQSEESRRAFRRAISR